MARHYGTDDTIDFTREATHRLRPPARLQGRARAIFVHLVKHTAANHFRPSDQALLERYCETQALAEQAADELAVQGAVTPDGRVSPWFQVHTVTSRTANSLASRLRLTVSARSPKTVKTQPGPQSYYDTMTLEEDDDADGDGADEGRH
jgi:phage terminase small subunit